MICLQNVMWWKFKGAGNGKVQVPKHSTLLLSRKLRVLTGHFIQRWVLQSLVLMPTGLCLSTSESCTQSNNLLTYREGEDVSTWG